MLSIPVIPNILKNYFKKEPPPLTKNKNPMKNEQLTKLTPLKTSW